VPIAGLASRPADLWVRGLINSGKRNVPKRPIAKKADKVLRGVQPNAGIEAAYRAKMQDLIAEMDKSVVYLAARGVPG
jgi:hypothetical protein